MPKNTAVETDKKLAKAFPKDVAPPQLLYDFAAWYRARPAGCLGGVELFASKMGGFLPPEADVDGDFALFFNMGDGGAAGFSILQDGKVEMYTDYHFEFAIGYDGFAPADFAADQARYPRKAVDLVDWHRALIEGG